MMKSMRICGIFFISIMVLMIFRIQYTIGYQFFTQNFRQYRTSRNNCPLHVVTTGPFFSPESSPTYVRESLLEQEHLATAILPQITPLEYFRLSRGEVIKKQNRNGHSGTGLVVLEVPADSRTVFNTLADFESYEKLIPTVRSAKIFRKSETIVKAQYSLSRFRLQANIIQTVVSDQNIIRFNLDESEPNHSFLKKADGFWYVEPIGDDTQRCRVWLTASITASRLLPSLIVDYAAQKALPRAINWMQPYFNALNAQTDAVSASKTAV